MSITKLFISYVLTFIVFFIIDMAWLGFIAKDLYKKYLGDLLSEQVNWVAAIVFYVLFIVGVFIFAIMPSVEKNSLTSAVTLGALFGFFTYATYDLTNLATLKNWPQTIVVIDIVWGSVLTAIVSTAGFFIVNYFNKQ
jgi:uncharacterized membrane protein